MDTRQVVGGEVWARAASISRDYKRILGNQFEKAWIKGVVLNVDKKKANDAAKRSTTYILARYPCEIHDGVQQYKEKLIAMQSLKSKDPAGDGGEGIAAPAAEEQQLPEAPTETATTAPPPNTITGGTPGETESVSTFSVSHATVTTATSTSTGSNSSGTREPVVEQNGRNWFEGNTEVEVNGKAATKFWKLVDQYGRGHEFTPGCDRGSNPKYSALDYFLAVFPKQQLMDMQERTSLKLQEENFPPTTIGEILQFFGVMLLVTRFEFGARASLWATTSRNRFIPTPNLGHTTGMSRDRFDVLWRLLAWSEQPYPRPSTMSHEEWRWCLVQDFVDNFNNHRESYYFASDLICADESMSRWYGLGGNWINVGLPHYVAMDSKPENGCEIQNCCDGAL